jgi:sirohydrochlorin ferrochelatase
VQRSHCFLFDNGSLRAASTLNLRAVARTLAPAIDAEISAVSLLHSSGVPAESLEGVSAELLEPALLKWLSKNPQGSAVLLPFFFGPSGALTEYLTERLRTIHDKFPNAEVRIARPLVDIQDPDTNMAAALADAARRSMNRHQLTRPKVLLVDHGSPQYSVTLVRNHLGDQVRTLIGDAAACVGVASMERRPGPEYAFTDPLLSNALASPPFNEGDVIVLLQFLSPGRHAGECGDIAEICGEAQRGCPQLRTYLTEPIGQDRRIIKILTQRYQEALQ